ncbi:MAG: EscU/YscU/HrcU family type III secretion system export apparatus switch protein [Gammaproteobacteria bacterium]|jgi:flagellar biosynthesis protein|nr:EscU/YscU/HrcU family type III secretion system export apparatus switch protein [Gammaproteobacteria bacterium]
MINSTQNRIAVALEYDGETAPKVTAKGVNDIADKIIEIATEHGIPLQQNDGLVEILSQMKLGDEIPEKLYRAVAEVIAFAYILTGKFPKNYTS